MSRTHEISPQQASADIDREFVDRRVWEKHPKHRKHGTEGEISAKIMFVVIVTVVVVEFNALLV